MKILMLTGSPHVNGSTALLADNFCAGAEAAGHQVRRVNCAKLNIRPCLGCESCRQPGQSCVHQDDMAQLYPLLREAEAMALVTPLYYFGMSAQLKTVIDRFFAINGELRQTRRQALLLAACGDEDSWAMDSLTSHYDLLCRYMNWDDKGRVLAYGAYTREDMEKNTAALDQARSLAAGL